MTLTVSGLRKEYGDKPAVDGISFSVRPDEIVGLLGPNGAGKTTTISMILGVLSPTAGNIEIDGIDVIKNHSRALARTNFAAVYAALPGNLTVIQNLRVFGLMYSVPNLEQRIENVIGELGLEQFRDKKAGVLSSGEQTRVSIAKAMLNNPSLLLLDEPTASLDPSAARDVRKMIKDIVAKHHTGVLWTSHNMNEVEQVCDRVMFMSKGRILLEGDPRTLPKEHGKATLEDLFITVAREPLTLKEAA